jgi:hypothetical protein
MKKIIFSLIVICTFSTFAHANNNQKTIDKIRKDLVLTEIQKEVNVTELGVIKEISNTNASYVTVRIPWVYVAWFIELHKNQGWSVEDAHLWASNIQSLADNGTVTWP